MVAKNFCKRRAWNIILGFLYMIKKKKVGVGWGQELESFNTAKTERLSNQSAISTPSPFVASNRNAGQSVTAVGLGLVPTLHFASPLSFPRLGWSRGSGLAVGTVEGEGSLRGLNLDERWLAAASQALVH